MVGNTGNTKSAGNTASAGNTTGASGWYFADRIDLPFVTLTADSADESGPATLIGSLRANSHRYPDRNWAADWYAWLALTDFVQTDWQQIDPGKQPNWPAWIKFPPPVEWATLNETNDVKDEVDRLVTAATDERPDALAEILSQSDEFMSYFLNLMTARPAAYPATTKVLTVANQIGTFVAMYFKGLYARPRPTELCPALLPPIEVPGHASFPSGHSTQAHLMALCMKQVLNDWPQKKVLIENLWVLAGRIARNREIAGVHYTSDTNAGIAIAHAVFAQMNKPLASGTPTRYQQAVILAREEWR